MYSLEKVQKLKIMNGQNIEKKNQLNDWNDSG